jgi:hypothetical protein
MYFGVTLGSHSPGCTSASNWVHTGFTLRVTLAWMYFGVTKYLTGRAFPMMTGFVPTAERIRKDPLAMWGMSLDGGSVGEGM